MFHVKQCPAFAAFCAACSTGAEASHFLPTIFGSAWMIDMKPYPDRPYALFVLALLNLTFAVAIAVFVGKVLQ